MPLQKLVLRSDEILRVKYETTSIHAHKNLYENVHSRVIHNSANVETARTDMNIYYTHTNCGMSFQ